MSEHDQSGNHWPDHGHESKWPSDSTGDWYDSAGRRRGCRPHRGIRFRVHVVLVLLCLLMTCVLLAGDYIRHLEQKAQQAKAREASRKAQDISDEVMRQIIGNPDKAMRDFKWPDISTPKQDDRKANKKGDVQ